MKINTVFPSSCLNEEDWLEEFNVGKLYSKYTPSLRLNTKEEIKKHIIEEAQKLFVYLKDNNN